MPNYIPVASVQATGHITKEPDWRGRPRFVLPVKFTFAAPNAPEARYKIALERKKDLPQALAYYQSDAARGRLQAEVHNGQVIATRQQIG